MNGTENGFQNPNGNEREDPETRVRRLAEKYIRDCKKELAEYGINIRSALELEFMLEDVRGKPVSHGIDVMHLHLNATSKATQALRQEITKSEPNLAHFIERVDYDNIVQTEFASPREFKYEVNIADTSSSYDPLGIAKITALVKEKALKDMLLSGTCLTPAGRSALPLHPNFSARPYKSLSKNDADGESCKRYYSTAGQHDNVSLWSDLGNNMFAASPDLYKQCAASLARIQEEAGIGFLPYENSLDRVSEVTNAPQGISISYSGEKDDVSVSMRNVHRFIESRECTRLENRLPGADADPIVVHALTLAALLDVVRNHLHKVENSDPDGLPPGNIVQTTKGIFRVDSTQETIKSKIPDHGTLARKLIESIHMQDLLGKPFQCAIFEAYGKDSTPAR